MHDLKPITALGGTTPRVDTVGETTLAEVPDLALASVAARAGREQACAKHLKALIGAQAPSPGKTWQTDHYSAVWMGPDQWMISADFATHEDIAATLKSQLEGIASVTEQTDAWACFDLSGPRVFAVLELLYNINLLQFKTGDATRTSIHHLGCFVICMKPDHMVRILGPRASAGSLHHAITTAMTSAL
ncbi:sarcosine oxidase subunit gamma [uncultured Tateyamaria sp.]|uniref:sarcosine oxidase subunit gamma n=1 Tax=uncultured Tateyamaria sp. TaxID=455651 RepID=UPI00261406B6|nr:sarcosine oxidase subunit gamma [uncultured Tateyamaria sp.]